MEMNLFWTMWNSLFTGAIFIQVLLHVNYIATSTARNKFWYFLDVEVFAKLEISLVFSVENRK